MSLFAKLAAIENTLGRIEVKLGLPQRRNLLVRRVVNDKEARTSTFTDTLLTPPPYITNVPTKYINLSFSINGAEGILISANDLLVEVSRTYPKELFVTSVGTKTQFVVDPPINEDGSINYSDTQLKTFSNSYFHNLTFLEENDPTIWRLILRREADRK